jgi:hypothetical protein
MLYYSILLFFKIKCEVYLKNYITELLFVGISIYFLSMKALDLADLFYLRALNILFIYYGANRMLKVIIKGKKDSFNAISALTTALVIVFISIAGLSYSYIQGGDKYIESLRFLFFVWETQLFNIWCFFTL